MNENVSNERLAQMIDDWTRERACWNDDPDKKVRPRDNADDHLSALRELQQRREGEREKCLEELEAELASARKRIAELESQLKEKI